MASSWRQTKQQFLKDPKPPSAADIAQAKGGSIVVDAAPEGGTVTALIQMQALNDAYLLVVRLVDPQVFGYYRRTVDAVSEYNRLDQNRLEVQLVFAALYAVVSLVTLLGAVWSGIWAANRLVRPISNLIDAAERVSEGDLTAHVKVARDDDELANLGHAFNRMTQQLSAQRGDLVAANRLNEERRRFTETVLSGVSAGVIGLDRDGKITIVNRAAARLLNATPDELEGRHYSESVPELGALIRRALSEPVGTRRRRSRHQARRHAPGTLGAGVQRMGQSARLCRHLRRHHRSGGGAAHRRLGRCGAPHRA